MKGKIVLVTGSTSGIGRQTVEVLAPMGATLVLSGRDATKLETLADDLRQIQGVGEIHTLLMDLSSQADIRRAAADFKAKFTRLDLLINNAGALFAKHALTKDGYEQTWALNHLGYFLLTDLLRDLLVASAPSRIINVASGAHARGFMHWDDLGVKKGYGLGWAAYCQSKLANILFTRELARQLEGTGVVAHCLHPGFVATSFMKNNGRFHRMWMALTRPAQRHVTDGADTVVWLATVEEPPLPAGQYFFNRKARRPSQRARNDEDAKRLWELSSEMVAGSASAS